MNTTLRTLVTALALSLPLYVSADSASINYRHQFTEEDSAHADRIKLNYRLDSGLGFEAEMKYRTAGDREDVAYDNLVNNGHEFTVSYNYKLSPQSTLTPAFQMDSSKDSTTYKLGLKYNYKINDAFYAATRYRLDTKSSIATRSTKTCPTTSRMTRPPTALRAGSAIRRRANGRTNTSSSISRRTTFATTTRRTTTNRT